MTVWIVIGAVVLLGIALIASGARASRGRAAEDPFGTGVAGLPGSTATSSLPATSAPSSPAPGWDRSAGTSATIGTGAGTPQAKGLLASLQTALASAQAGSMKVSQESQVIDASNVPGLRDAVLQTLTAHGVDVQGAGAPAPGAPAAGEDDPLDLLENLAELKAAGALTDAEFETAKRRILADT